MKTAKLTATCDSEKCAFIRKSLSPRKQNGKAYKRDEQVFIGVQIKIVQRDTIACPDCGSALFWTREQPQEEV